MSRSDIDAMKQGAALKWRDKHLAGEYERTTEVRLHYDKELYLDPNSSLNEKLQKHHRLEHPRPEDDLQL